VTGKRELSVASKKVEVVELRRMTCQRVWNTLIMVLVMLFTS
jgi:hypothetical protein